MGKNKVVVGSKRVQPGRSPRRKKLKISVPMAASTDYQCSEHSIPLEMYCCTDSQCICPMCALFQHTKHKVVSVSEERQTKQEELQKIKTQAGHQRLQMEGWMNLRAHLENIQNEAQATKEYCESVVAQLIDCLQRHYDTIEELVDDQTSVAIADAQHTMQNLENRLKEQKHFEAELEDLCHTDDDVQFLQTWPSLMSRCEASGTPSVSECNLLRFESIKEAVKQFGKLVEEFCDKEIDTISQKVSANTEPTVSTDTRPIVSSQTRPTVSSNTGPTVSSQTRPTVSSQTEPTVSSNTGPIVSSHTGPTVSSNTGPTVSSQTRPTVSSHTGPTVSSNTGPTVSSQTRPIVSSQTRPTVSSQTRPTVSSNTGLTVSSHTGPTVSSQTGPTVSSHTEPTVSSQTKPTVSSNTGPTVSSQTKPTVSSQTGPTVSSQTKPTVSSHTRPTVSSQTKPTVSSYNRPTVSSHTGPTVSSYNRPTVSSNTGPTFSSHNRPTVSSQTGPTVSSNTGPTVSSNTGPTVSSQTRPTVSSQTRPTVSSQTRPTVSSHNRPTVSSHTGPTVSSQTGPTVSSQTGPTVSSQTGPTVNSTHTGLTPEPRTRTEFLEYACELTLDPNTAHRELVISNGQKEVKMSSLPTGGTGRHPEQFTYRRQVLCEQGLQAERCYYEVEVYGEKAEIALAYKRMDRKSRTSASAFGGSDMSWSLDRSRTYSVSHNSDSVQLTSTPRQRRIGVYLKFKEGSLTFYEVSEYMKFLYRVETTFREPLYPGFWLEEKGCIRLCDLRKDKR